MSTHDSDADDEHEPPSDGSAADDSDGLMSALFGDGPTVSPTPEPPHVESRKRALTPRPSDATWGGSDGLRDDGSLSGANEVEDGSSPSAPDGTDRLASESPSSRPSSEEILAFALSEPPPLVASDAPSSPVLEAALEQDDSAWPLDTDEPPTARLSEASALPPRELLRDADVPGPLREGVPLFRREQAADDTNEVRAADRIHAAGERDAWLARAVWLQEEASLMPGGKLRARTLLALSEIYAMLGEPARASTAAVEARELLPQSPMLKRQERGIAASNRDFAAVLASADDEAENATTSLLRGHAARFGASVARLALGQNEGHDRRLARALEETTDDGYARFEAHLQRYAAELFGQPSPAAPAREACLEALGLPSTDENEVSSALHRELCRARAAIDGGDADALLAALSALGAFPSLRSATDWLFAAFAAVRGTTRRRALDVLRGLGNGPHGSAARTALAARSLELGEPTASSLGFDGEGGTTHAERLGLGLLVGGSDAELARLIEALSSEADWAPLAAAAASFVVTDGSGAAEALALNEGDSSRDFAVGRTMTEALHGSADTWGPVLARASSLAEKGAWSAVLALEAALAERSGKAVAEALGRLRGVGPSDALVASGIVAEAALDTPAAIEAYDRALAAEPSCEIALRSRVLYGDAASGAKIVSSLAPSVGGARASMLLVEAAVRLGPTAPAEAVDPILWRAAELDPASPFASFLGSTRAIRERDRAARLRWLEWREKSCSDPLERAHVLVERALLVEPVDRAEASDLLRRAVGARPADFALRDLLERLAPEALVDAGAWRTEASTKSSENDARVLLLEAALDHEQSGEPALAALAAARATSLGDADLAAIVAERLALSGHGAGALIERLLPLAREGKEPAERAEIFERLADLDDFGRRDRASALLWHRSLIEQVPDHLPSLVRLSLAFADDGREDDLENVALAIARSAKGSESLAHAALAARLRARLSGWEDTREAVTLGYRVEPRDLWILRKMGDFARISGDHLVAADADEELVRRTDRASEIATLSLRAARSAMGAGLRSRAELSLRRAIEHAPDHIVLHLELAGLLERSGEFASAAATFENAARVALRPEERVTLLHRAAVLWGDRCRDKRRARLALEAVTELDPSYGDAFARLRALYEAEGATTELFELARRRLTRPIDPGPRTELEILVGRGHVARGDASLARRALKAALDAHPDHVDALGAFADLCAAEGEWAEAENAWIRLARLVPDPARQAALYLHLAEIYDVHLPNAERAELACLEVLKRDAGHTAARERLVSIHMRAGDVRRATEEQHRLIEGATSVALRCRHTVDLARLHETVGDFEAAERILGEARTAWPVEVDPVLSLVRLMTATGQVRAADAVLDRAVLDAQSAIAEGRFEGLELTAAVWELRGRDDGARIARAMSSAVVGSPSPLRGLGARVAAASLDDLLAPESLPASLRALVARSAPLFDAALPVDLARLGARPLDAGPMRDLIDRLASAYGLAGIRVHVTDLVGPLAVAISAEPSSILVGRALLDPGLREGVRAFAIHRALKLVQVGAAALVRTPEADLVPLFAAIRREFLGDYVLLGDQAERADALALRWSGKAPIGDARELTLLAEQALSGSDMADARTIAARFDAWACRVALAAVGDPADAIDALIPATAEPSSSPAAIKESRARRSESAEVRELVAFGASPTLVELRARFAEQDA